MASSAALMSQDQYTWLVALSMLSARNLSNANLLSVKAGFHLYVENVSAAYGTIHNAPLESANNALMSCLFIFQLDLV